MLNGYAVPLGIVAVAFSIVPPGPLPSPWRLKVTPRYTAVSGARVKLTIGLSVRFPEKNTGSGFATESSTAIECPVVESQATPNTPSGENHSRTPTDGINGDPLPKAVELFSTTKKAKRAPVSSAPVP